MLRRSAVSTGLPRDQVLVLIGEVEELMREQAWLRELLEELKVPWRDVRAVLRDLFVEVVEQGLGAGHSGAGGPAGDSSRGSMGR